MQKVICEHPTLIVNRSLLSFIRKGGIFYTIDNCKLVSTWNLTSLSNNIDQQNKDLLHKLSRFFWQQKKVVDADRSLIDNCYFINGITGEVCPIFVEVPCGHCVICSERKRSSFAARCTAECQCHAYPPLFITLTYDDEHLPEQGLQYEDVQKFMKRLRITLLRKYFFDGDLRYAVCGEYGGRTKRAHYHMLLWNFPFIPNVNWIKLNNEVFNHCWKNGITQVKRAYSEGAGYYIGKYMAKPGKTPEGKTPVFVHGSTKNGGIGSLWIKQHAKYILDNADILSIKYVDKFSGKAKDMPMVKYFIDKVFPTVSMSIPKAVRDAYGDFIINLDALNKYDREKGSRYLYLFSELNIQIPQSLAMHVYDVPSFTYPEIEYNLDCALATLKKYSGKDYSDADYFADRRNLYFSNIAQKMPEIDIADKVYCIKKRLAKEEAKYIKC